MPDFAYTVIDPQGRERRGRLSATDGDAARAVLEQKRLFVVRMAVARAETTGGPPLLSLPGRAPRLATRDLTLFTRQLSTLASVSPLEEALRTIARQSEKPGVRAVVEQVHGGVLGGRSLAEALSASPRSFPPLYRAMIAAGERSGSLPALTERLAILLERQAEVRARVLAAIAYPVALAVFALFVTVALMIFVVPLVVEQFDMLGQQLPLLTRIVMGLSLLLARWWWVIGLVLVGAGLLGLRLLRIEDTRRRLDGLLLRLPLAGRLIRDLHAARMARTLSTMVASRLPVVEGLAMVAPTVHNRVLRAATVEIAEAVRGGGSLSAALRRAEVFPPLLVYLTASGEAAGALDSLLERAADYLEREVDAHSRAALSLLEPAIILLMGGVVALIILSILLPILQLQTFTLAGS